jgi:hypothetical protein
LWGVFSVYGFTTPITDLLSYGVFDHNRNPTYDLSC